MEKHYKLRCRVCDSLFEDDGLRLACPHVHAPSLLSTQYSSQSFDPDDSALGIYRYHRWLPGSHRLQMKTGSITYQSQKLNAMLNLPNLWIAFSGYWPERGARLETATFKELEVCGVLSRMPTGGIRALVVASAGNTAAAFARACSENEIPCLIVVPVAGMKQLRFSRPLNACVKVVCLTGGAAYSDAITLAEQIAQEDGFVSEGGVKNVGRRDGMGTAMLNAVETIGRLPGCYFQAIGSGAGAIAAHEAARRLIEDGRFGDTFPRLMLSQNLPFTPIHDSWKRGSGQLIESDPQQGRDLTKRILATVLSNQRPPYSIAGGMFEVLSESKGDMFAVRNEEVVQASRLFETCEGIDIDPAAGVALASLITSARSGAVDREGVILLHITGGGARRRALDQKLASASPSCEITLRELQNGKAVEVACALFAEKNSCQPA